MSSFATYLSHVTDYQLAGFVAVWVVCLLLAYCYGYYKGRHVEAETEYLLFSEATKEYIDFLKNEYYRFRAIVEDIAKQNRQPSVTKAEVKEVVGNALLGDG